MISCTALIGDGGHSRRDPDLAYYDTYIAWPQTFARAAAVNGATTILSNHTGFDFAYFKAATAARLRVIDRDDVNVPKRYVRDVPNPYDVGRREVINDFGAVELCAKAATSRATGSL